MQWQIVHLALMRQLRYRGMGHSSRPHSTRDVGLLRQSEVKNSMTFTAEFRISALFLWTRFN